jgi:uncharacterized Tic20 family protein
MHTPLPPFDTRAASEEERVFAALAHMGVFANGFALLGIIGALLIWASQGKRSAYVAAHALQALVFQVFMLLFSLLLLLLGSSVLMLAFLPAILRPDLYESDPPVAFRMTLLVVGLILMSFIFGVLSYALAGAWAAWRGRSFGYVLVRPFIGLLQHEDEPSPSSAAPASSAADVQPAQEAAD